MNTDYMSSVTTKTGSSKLSNTIPGDTGHMALEPTAHARLTHAAAIGPAYRSFLPSIPSTHWQCMTGLA